MADEINGIGKLAINTHVNQYTGRASSITESGLNPQLPIKYTMSQEMIN